MIDPRIDLRIPATLSDRFFIAFWANRRSASKETYSSGLVTRSHRIPFIAFSIVHRSSEIGCVYQRAPDSISLFSLH